MITYEKFTLNNGLRVIVYPLKHSQVATLNIMYNVGSRDEEETKTGFAHLFEHLMFGGSKNISNYDEALQKVGGTNNAYTSSDVTNYYCSLPSANIETAFWLESDRMMELDFNPTVLDIQKKVVTEEFKEGYLNKPYGSYWPAMCKLAYKHHPYQWPTIGKDISHIEDATMEDVKAFFYKYYKPNNAVLVVAGGVTVDQVKTLSEKWFGPIAAGDKIKKEYKKEPMQTSHQLLTIEDDVPLNAIYKAYHIPGRLDKDYHSTELLSAILGSGKSSRLHKSLVKEKKYFSTLYAYVSGTFDPGLMVITGKLNDGIDFQVAESAIEELIDEIKHHEPTAEELEKVQNQYEAHLLFGELDMLTVSQELATHEILGDSEMINCELHKFKCVTTNDIKTQANKLLEPKLANTIYYAKK